MCGTTSSTNTFQVLENNPYKPELQISVCHFKVPSQIFNVYLVYSK